MDALNVSVSFKKPFYATRKYLGMSRRRKKNHIRNKIAKLLKRFEGRKANAVTLEEMTGVILQALEPKFEITTKAVDADPKNP